MSVPVSTPIRVFVVAAPLPRWGLQQLLRSSGDRCACAGTAPALRNAIPLLERHRADVVLFADDRDNAGELREFCAAATQKVLLVTASHDERWQDQAILAGARGIVRADDAAQFLTTAIEHVSRGELWIDRCATGRLFLQMLRRQAEQQNGPEDAKIARLTLRERQTVLAVAGAPELPAKVIAARLCISEHTLRNHLSSIYSKLALRNRTHLYAYAKQHRLHERYGTGAHAPGALSSPPGGTE